MVKKLKGTNISLSLLQLILATIPTDGQVVGPSIVNDENILLMFEIQEKVWMRIWTCFGLLLVFYSRSHILVSNGELVHDTCDIWVDIVDAIICENCAKFDVSCRSMDCGQMSLEMSSLYKIFVWKPWEPPAQPKVFYRCQSISVFHYIVE